MANFFTALNDDLKAFIAEQKLFFVATAPSAGRLNLSPKGLDTFRCLDDRTVAYLDLTGSGNETAAHLVDDGRMTVMFCSFTRKPLILRLYGHGRVVQPHDEAWPALFAHFDPVPGQRQIIVLDVDSVQTSCGYAVPQFAFQAERDTLRRWAEHKGEEELAAYRAKKNQRSIDGLEVYRGDGV